MRIIAVQPTDNYTLVVDFENGSRVNFNMKRMVETIAYKRMRDPEIFRSVKFEDKAVYWDPPDGRPEIFPLRITLDEILFSLR